MRIYQAFKRIGYETNDGHGKSIRKGYTVPRMIVSNIVCFPEDSRIDCTAGHAGSRSRRNSGKKRATANNSAAPFPNMGYNIICACAISVTSERVEKNSAAGITGIPVNIEIAKAPPKISANAVAIDAATAVRRRNPDKKSGKCVVAASARHRPVTIPKWATLCCKKTSIMRNNGLYNKKPPMTK